MSQHTNVSDPGKLLSMKEVVSLLMKHNGDYCNSSINEALKTEREHCNTKLDIIVKALGDNLATAVTALSDQANALSKKIADIDMKTDVVSSYLEQQLYSLADTLRQAETSLKFLSSETRTCYICNSRYESPSEMQRHMHSQHSSEARYLRTNSNESTVAHSSVPHSQHTPCFRECNECGLILSDENNLQKHLTMYHGCVNPPPDQSTTHHTHQITQVYQSNQTYIPGYEAGPECYMTSYLHACYLCGYTFSTSTNLEEHIHTDHGITYYTESQNNLGNINLQPHFPLLQDGCTLDRRDSVTTLHCNYCDNTFNTMMLLNKHIRNCHSPDPNTTNQSLEKCYTKNLNCEKEQTEKEDNRAAPLTILQVDGNCTFLSDSCVTPTDEVRDCPTLTTSTPSEYPAGNNISDHIMLGTTRGTTSSMTDSLQLQYTLNPANQAKRLYENTDRPSLDIRYNNPQTIQGRQHPTNVTIECNSGVYLAAVKPGLEAISKGWQTQVSQTLISCDDLTPRKDMSGRLVCTKLVLYLTERSNPTTRCRTVLHFYHTSCTVQVQGSSLLSCGTCSPVWLTKHFLEPLALKHTNQNKDEIESINANIRQSATSTCSHCHTQLNPAAFHPKDQEISCSKCKALFHKKCTDRKKSTGNWRKSPWFCQSCILDTHAQGPLQPPDQTTQLSQAHNHTGRDDHHINHSQGRPHQPPETPLTRFLALNSQHIEQDSLNTGTQTTSQPVTSPNILPGIHPQLQPLTIAQPSTSQPRSTQHHVTRPLVHNSVSQVTSTVIHGEPLSSLTTQSSTSISFTSTSPSQTTSSLPQISCSSASATFPTTASRQRSSNIAIQNPEYEFQQTALSACRSTIAQQETELKTLKEGINIRNKRILQLESQIGAAAESVAGRDFNKDTTETTRCILSRIESIENKISNIKGTNNNPPNSIVINNCKSGHSNLKHFQSVMTQTTVSHCACEYPSPCEPPSMDHLSDSDESPGMAASGASTMATGDEVNLPTQEL